MMHSVVNFPKQCLSLQASKKAKVKKKLSIYDSTAERLNTDLLLPAIINIGTNLENLVHLTLSSPNPYGDKYKHVILLDVILKLPWLEYFYIGIYFQDEKVSVTEKKMEHPSGLKTLSVNFNSRDWNP